MCLRLRSAIKNDSYVVVNQFLRVNSILTDFALQYPLHVVNEQNCNRNNRQIIDGRKKFTNFKYLFFSILFKIK